MRRILAIAALVVAMGTTTAVHLRSAGATHTSAKPLAGSVTEPVAKLVVPLATAPLIARAVAPVRPEGPARVVLYGDSLASEAQDGFVAAFTTTPGVEIRAHTFGGTAICDWLDIMRAEATEWTPHAVVVEFSGNALTPCMAGVEREAKYEADTNEVLSIFREVGAVVYVAGSPISRGAAEKGEPAGMNALYQRLVSSVAHGRYLDAGNAVLDHGRYTDTLPCLPSEPCTGGTSPDGTRFNVVRSPDGAHFCPDAPQSVNGVTTTCPAWSSGAYRFGLAMAEPVLRDLGLAATS